MTRIKEGFVTIPQALRLRELILIVELIDSTLWRYYLESHRDDASAVLEMLAVRFNKPPAAMEALRASVADARNRPARAALLSATVRFIYALELPTLDDFYSGPPLFQRIDLSCLSTPVGDSEPC